MSFGKKNITERYSFATEWEITERECKKPQLFSLQNALKVGMADIRKVLLMNSNVFSSGNDQACLLTQSPLSRIY
ncbi:hypothetical protein EGI16_20645 [Chryseobacterium sp. G0240]|uniref:hypothetical protein n=1 Tax=Chryseobacterium sp. G0240 TaxID=2487066 RepID=UPI000F457A5F|nr:hypothetical protein [Chryseobacterium sp. G0240]ROH98961.1 hypothetical protein EGI16_20645 [Chryseobacterium sp. G0240]